MVPPKGSKVHSSGSTPTVSAWPASRIGFSVGLAARSRAIRCALPAAGVWTISTSKPSGRSRAASSSATCASLPGGLLVLTRTRSRSSVTTSLSCACAALGANKPASTAIPAMSSSHAPGATRFVMLQPCP